MPDLPASLKLEVKTSRSGSFQLGERDIEGVSPDGFVVALLNDRRLHGPTWVLVPARVLSMRGFTESEIAELSIDSDLARALNQGWSNWILDREATTKVLEGGSTRIKERVEWCRRERPPRENLRKGNIREVYLHEALGEFRDSVDAISSPDLGPQLEGQIHQYLLEDILEQLDYSVLPNPVGVPDIRAETSKARFGTNPRDRLEKWTPSDQSLQELRILLLQLEDDQLEELANLF